MAWIKSRRTRQRRSQGLPEAVPATRWTHRFWPRLEPLENRVQPGDTLLGVSVVALQAFAFASWDTTLAIVSEGCEQTTPARRGSGSEWADPLAGLPGTQPSSREEPGPGRIVDRTPQNRGTPNAEPLELALPEERAGVAAIASSWRDEAAVSGLPALAAASGQTVAGGEQQGAGVASSVSFVGRDASAGRAGLWFAVGSALSFDTARGELAIRAGSGPHTVREAVAVDGFVEITLDGQRHSSNPGSPAFDRALAGASARALAAIRFDGHGDDTLILGSGHLPGPLAVAAGCGTVVTENVAAAGPLVIQAANITVHGTLQGSGVSLAAAHLVNVNATGRIQAGPSAAGSGIAVSAGTFVNSGELRADGLSGGQIVVQASKILNAGPITADATGHGGNGGQVDIAFTQSYIATAAAEVSVRNAAGPAGHLTIDGGSTGRLYSSGRYIATGSTGGSVDLLGREVVLVGAAVDASGETGGGTLRIGGDFQGRNSAVGNAQTVSVTGTTTLRADALRQGGNGGRVAVWSDQDTTFAGSVSARGGAGGGAGGFIEVSSTGNLAYGGTADAGAVAGPAGTLLLDPKNLVVSDAPEGIYPQYDLIDPHPTPGGSFGHSPYSLIRVLNNGNVLVPNIGDDFGGSRAGAIYLFDGQTGALLSSLVGSSANDQVGTSIILLSNGNFVVESPSWNDNRGAVTWGTPTAGVSGVVSADNSLVGSSSKDQVGFPGYLAITLLSNGNYVVESPQWNGGRGAVTFGNGDTGVRGTISEANSLIGSEPGDTVGYPGVAALSNGNYVVLSFNWNIGRGAATWGSGTAGVTGVVSAANSLVGSDPYDEVGNGVLELTNGNYVVRSTAWHRLSGAATWGSGTAGVKGEVSAANSLVGSGAGQLVGDDLLALDNGNYVLASGRGEATWGNGNTGISGVVSAANSLIGYGTNMHIAGLANSNYVVFGNYWNGGRGAVTWGNGASGTSGVVSAENSLVGSHPDDEVGREVDPLSNGNYVVVSELWNSNRGAVTWGSGETGVRGVVAVDNSLVGSNPNDYVGADRNGYRYITRLSNGNYVVASPSWNGQRGAITWGSGTSGVTGEVSAVNSLVGSNPDDQVGYFFGVEPLANGNYVVSSFLWNANRGAVTWGDGRTGSTGVVSEVNSLVGSDPGDTVGNGGVVCLSNGNYVAASRAWNGRRGAATWGNGASGTSGIVSAENSLVGSNPGDQVGSGIPSGREQPGTPAIIPLPNGNYVVSSPFWNDNRGAATWSSTEGIRGLVSAANSFVGSNVGDEVGSSGIFSLNNGNYVIPSPDWNGSRGAETWGSGTDGLRGVVSADNSLIGSNSGDQVGSGGYFGLQALSNGDYVVLSRQWNGNRGAATWIDGATGQPLNGLGVITPQNSILGTASIAFSSNLAGVVENRIAQTFSAVFFENGGRVTVGLTDPSQLAYATAQGQSLTITPEFLTRTLDTGTAVVLQASNDLTVNSPIRVQAGGKGGALTLQAGRSIVLNASITTDNGPLTLIANDSAANGVVDTQHDPGSAVITMAPGTILDTGSAPLSVQLRDGAGLTNHDSGVITLQSVTAGMVWVVNRGPSTASDVQLGTVTSSGSQYYADPHGSTRVNGNLSTDDRSITFADSVTVEDGVAVTAGANAVYFVGSGIQALHSGNGTTFGNINHTATGTLQLTSSLTVTGSFVNATGTFDANDQPVTVSGAAAILGGTYLAGTAPQNFQSGVSILTGALSSATGPMDVRGEVRLLGGALRGAGGVDAVAALGGTVVPGGDNPGVLSITGALALDSSSTVSILLNGAEPGTGYAQLQAGGPVDLGSSTLRLTFGFVPPVGSSLEILTNSGSAPISGIFNGLDEGAIFTQGAYQFQITYQGGTGDDSVVLTRLV